MDDAVNAPPPGDVLQSYLAQKREEEAKPEDVSEHYFVIASSMCPICGYAIVVYPRHLEAMLCRGCGEPLVVMLAPCKFSENNVPLVGFQVRARDNTWHWVYDPRRVSVDKFFETFEGRQPK